MKKYTVEITQTTGKKGNSIKKVQCNNLRDVKKVAKSMLLDFIQNGGIEWQNTEDWDEDHAIQGIQHSYNDFKEVLKKLNYHDLYWGFLEYDIPFIIGYDTENHFYDIDIYENDLYI